MSALTTASALMLKRMSNQYRQILFNKILYRGGIKYCIEVGVINYIYWLRNGIPSLTS